MRNATHTPGPWEFSHVPGEYGHVITVAEGELAEAFSEAVGQEQAIANARLIASAPELLALLRRINEAFYVHGTRKALLPVMAQTKALIAKANGDQP